MEGPEETQEGYAAMMTELQSLLSALTLNLKVNVLH